MAITSAPPERRAPSGPLSEPSRSWLSTVRGPQQFRVIAIALVAVLARLPFLASDPSRDEAGFLLVGQQWHSGGSSLYGNYWVDRPPLLITIFRAAAELGGLVPLRLIGCLATALVVLGSAHVASRLGGRRAGPWAALVAAALCVTPLLGGESVNGELLSAPFVVGGLAAVLAAVQHPVSRTAVWAAAAAGAATMSSLLVKQNMADVAVFAVVVLLLAWRRGEITAGRLVRVVAGAVAGAVVCLSVVAAWTLAHGTSLVGVYDAMYPFRVEAGRVMAASDRTKANARLWALAISWGVSGGAVIMLVATRALFGRRLRSSAVCGLGAMVLYAGVSIALGGSYWTHYLIELVVPVAVLSGVLVAQREPIARAAVGVVAVAATVALGIDLAGTHSTAGTSVGEAIGQASRAQDTIITTWGHADVTRAAGLSSPYPYLWSLPARTLDPRLSQLDAVLSGPNAPTWFVAWTDVDTWGDHGGGAAATARVLAADYAPVTRVGDHTVYLHRGVDRPTPRLGSPAAQVASPTSRNVSEPRAKERP